MNLFHRLRKTLSDSATLELALTITLLVVALGAVFWFKPLNNEGWLTYIGARFVGSEPAAGLFSQKFHPTISLLYAPLAALGWTPMVVLHILIGASAVYFTGATARRWGGSGWVASLVLAASPIYFVSLITGQTNSTGIFFLSLALFLYRPPPRWAFASGLVAGASIWTRYEQIPYILGLLAHSVLVRRDWRFVAGFAVIPALYVGAGAVYHQDLLWIFTWPPNNVASTPGAEEYLVGQLAISHHYVSRALHAIFLASPLWLLPFAVRWTHASADLRLVGVLLALVFTLMVVMPLAGHWFNFETSSRYMLNPLVPTALIIGWAWQTRPLPARIPSALLVLGLVVLGLYTRGAVEGLLGLVPFVVALGFVWLPRRMAVTLVAASLLLVPVSMYFAEKPVPDQHFVKRGKFRVVAEWLEEAPGTTIYTDSQDIGMYLQSIGMQDRVRILVGYDILVEMAELLNAENGQRAAFWSALRPNFYGGSIWPCEFPRTIQTGDLLSVREDTVAAMVYDLEPWLAALEFQGQVGRRRVVYRNNGPEFTVPYLKPAGWIDEESTCSPCPAGCPE